MYFLWLQLHCLPLDCQVSPNNIFPAHNNKHSLLHTWCIKTLFPPIIINSLLPPIMISTLFPPTIKDSFAAHNNKHSFATRLICRPLFLPPTIINKHLPPSKALKSQEMWVSDAFEDFRVSIKTMLQIHTVCCQ